MADFILLPLQPADIANCVNIYFAAFQNAHSLGCWPRIPSVRAWWENMITDELYEPGAHWLKAVSKQTGEIAGFAKWQEPKSGKESDTALPQWPEGADTALCDETFGAWARKHGELMGVRGHWCELPLVLDLFSILATDKGQRPGDSSNRPCIPR